LISADGEQLGMIAIEKAIEMAKSQGLDLVEVAPDSKPPVCRLIDYGKFRYEEKRRKQEAKKRGNISKLKEVQISLKIGVNDLAVKLNSVYRFINSGYKTKLSLQFKGREVVYIKRGGIFFNKIIQLTEGFADLEAPPKMEGRKMIVILIPKSLKGKKKDSPEKGPIPLKTIMEVMKEVSIVSSTETSVEKIEDPAPADEVGPESIEPIIESANSVVESDDSVSDAEG